MKHLIPHKAQGFTLLELMVTVAVLAVISALAAPSFKQLLAAQRVRVSAYNIVSDLVLARSEAVKRGENVTVTPTASQWANGWSVSVASTAEILGGQGSVGNGVQFTASPASVTFDRNGRTTVVAVVRFALTDGGTHPRCISLDPSGRPKNASTVCPS
ncbi:MAG: GspH/FimT family pseudopilin [Pseudomonadota bacterium]